MRKYFLPLLVITILFACKKDILENDQSATLNFSTDTITFDTVFASIGSITKTLTVYNNNNFGVQTDIELKGSSAGHFRMNIDGIAGNNQSNIEIPAKDSIFIFLEVTIDPSLINTTPYILTDSLVFTTGTKQQDVDVVAWGQDAYFHTADTSGQIIDGDNIINFPYHQIDWECRAARQHSTTMQESCGKETQSACPGVEGHTAKIVAIVRCGHRHGEYANFVSETSHRRGMFIL